MVHLGKGEIEGFLAGRLPPADRRRVVLHLLGGCSHCQRRMKTLAAPLLGDEPWKAVEPVAEERYEGAIDRAQAAAPSLLKRWRKETAKLEQALALLDQAPGGLGDVRLPWRQVQALHGWPLCEALLRKSYELRFSDPKRMLDLAESAAGVAEHIRAEKYPWPGLVADLRARAFAELGNAYRINDRLSAADAAFARAEEFLEEGTGDPVLQARVLDLFASLRSAQRRLEETIALLDQVYRLYLEADDPHLAGRALVSMGGATHYFGHPREAVNLFEKGLRLLKPERDAQLIAIAQEGLLHALTDSGEYRLASRRLLQSGLREAFADEPLNLLRLRWVEGKIHAGLSRPARAERAFLEVRRGFLRLGQVYDASLAGLDLSALWLRQGRAAEVRTLAEEMHETFDELGVEREAARALYFLREACRVQSVTLPMIERVRRFLERLPWHPGLRFEPALFAP